MVNLWEVFVVFCTIIGFLVVLFVAFMVTLDVYEWYERKYRVRFCDRCHTKLNRRTRAGHCVFCETQHAYWCHPCQLTHEHGIVWKDMPTAWETATVKAEQ